MKNSIVQIETGNISRPNDLFGFIINDYYLGILNAHFARFLKNKARRRKKREKRALQKSFSFKTLHFIHYPFSIILLQKHSFCSAKA